MSLRDYRVGWRQGQDLAGSCAAERWNVAHPSGTSVWIQRDDGRRELTKTRSAAWLLADRVPVVLVEGRTGGYALSRLTPVSAKPPAPVPRPVGASLRHRVLLPASLFLTAVLAFLIAVVAIFSPKAARAAVSTILRDVEPSSWLDVLRSRLIA